jgi:hypothetical protein
MAQSSASITGTIGVTVNRGAITYFDGNENSVFFGTRLEAVDQTGMESVLGGANQVWRPTYAAAPATASTDAEFQIGVPATSSSATSGPISSATAQWSANANGGLSFALSATTAASGGYASAYTDLWLQFSLAPQSKVTVSLSNILLSTDGQDAGVFPTTASLESAPDSSSARLIFESTTGSIFSDARLFGSNADGFAYEATQNGGGNFVFTNTSTTSINYFSLKIEPSVYASSFRPAPVPEPQTYAMMLLGITGIAAFARRKRGQA